MELIYHVFFQFYFIILICYFFINPAYSTVLNYACLISDCELFFHIVAQVWDALHLYIANNLDWMEHWIEYCEECFGRLSWEGVSEMIKTAHRQRHQFPDLTSQREVDLAYGLKDKKESKLFTHIFLVTSHFFNVFGLFNFSNIFSNSYMMFINSQCIFYLLSML